MPEHWHILIRNSANAYLRQIEGTYLRKETAILVAKAVRTELDILGDQTSVAVCRRPMCRLTFQRNQIWGMMEKSPITQEASFAEKEAAFEEAGVPPFQRVVCPTCSSGINIPCTYPRGGQRHSHTSRAALYGAMKTLAKDREST